MIFVDGAAVKIIRDFFGQKRAFPIVLFLLGFFILGCMISEFLVGPDSSKFPEDPRVDRSFVTGQPCEVPCWYGLKVGQSTLDDIRKTLPQLPFANADQIHEQPTGDFGPNEKWFTVPCVYSEEFESCAELETLPDGILRRIIIHIDYDLPLQLAIQKLGNPEYYTSNPLPDKDICSLGIYWPQKNIVAAVKDELRTERCSDYANETIDLDLQVVSLVYVEISDQKDYDIYPWPTSAP